MATATAKYRETEPIESVTLTLSMREAQLVRDVLGVCPHEDALDPYVALGTIPELKLKKNYFKVTRPGEPQ